MERANRLMRRTESGPMTLPQSCSNVSQPSTSRSFCDMKRAQSMDLLKTLKDLIAIPSINPMRPNSGEAAEQAAIAYLEALLRREQIDCERQMVADGRENLIAVVHATAGGSDSGGLLLNSHIDTVPVADMTIDPFDPVLKDDRIFGRGSCDAKASIAAMLTAL